MVRKLEDSEVRSAVPTQEYINSKICPKLNFVFKLPPATSELKIK